MSSVQPDSWRRTGIGVGAVQETPGGFRLTTDGATATSYSNAQIDDYAGLTRSSFPWRPPVTLRLRARFSQDADADRRPGLRGTAGFGFWNDFFMAGRRPTLPGAAWFFYASPPSDMQFALDTPGYGWKAATIDALRPATPLMLASTVAAVPLMNSERLYRRIWPHYQRALKICEQIAPAAMDAWHSYTLEWGTTQVRFSVDDEVIMECASAPAGPLGLVVWLDNQYLVARPWGRLRWGLLATDGPQWLEIADLDVSDG